MKKYFYISLLFILIGSLTSCEDPIDLDLGAPKPQLVIDAVINQTADTQWINISKSVGYLNNGAFVGYKVDSLVAVVDTSDFSIYPFTYKNDGRYFFVPPSANTFKFNKNYQLVVIDNKNTFVSQSKLNSPTVIDSFTYRFEPNGFFGNPKGNFLSLWAKDKPGAGDFYWIRLTRNDSLQTKASDIKIAIDNSTTEGGKGDGDLFIVPIRDNLHSRPFASGEKAQVEILTITPEMYYYLNLVVVQLQNIGLFAVPPANVPTNIICLNNPNIKVLGFFCMTGKVLSPVLNIP